MADVLTSDILSGAGIVTTAPCPQGGAGPSDCYSSQDQKNWCWAACAQTLLKHLNASSVPQQCEIAGRHLGRECCRAPSWCDQPCPFGQIQPLLERLGVDCRTVLGVLPEDELATELQQRRPVQLGYYHEDRPSDGHFVVVAGATRRRTLRREVRNWTLLDPLVGPVNKSYQELTTDGDHRSWRWTWREIRLRGDP